MRVFLAAMSAIVVLLIGSAQAKDCRGPHFNLVDGGTTEAVLYISTDKICDIHFEMPSSDRGEFGILASRVLARPKNGILGKSSIRHFALKPNPGFAGDDAFEIEVTYDRNRQKTVSNLHFTVHVQPGGF
jgi:hypothetical protein